MRINWTLEKIQQEASKYAGRHEFEKKAPKAYAAARRCGILNKVCSHMNIIRKIWTNDEIITEMSKFNTKSEFKKHNQSAYKQAVKRNLIKEKKFDSIYHTNEDLILEAKKYTTRKSFNENSNSMYVTAYNRGILDQICSHMPKRIPKSEKYTIDQIKQMAKQYTTRTEFKDNCTFAYRAALRRGILDKICFHMIELVHNWTNEELKIIALKYKTRNEFQKNDKNAWQVARKRELLDNICVHMGKSGSVSNPEKFIFDVVKTKYPKVQKLRDTKARIEGKPYIKGFDIDIYIPELRKGIEFDGTYWHSVPGLKRSREDWPEEDLINYSKIKDEYFSTKSIRIIHINEKDWIDNKEVCIEKCFEFLGISNER